MKTEQLGSVRIDLLGGTLDIPPMHLIIPDVVTINLATDLEAKVQIEDDSEDQVVFKSLDYGTVDKFRLSDISKIVKEQSAGNLNFLLTLLHAFSPTKGLSIVTQSGSPAGAGLGGSSAMGITFAKALNFHLKAGKSAAQILLLVQNVEAKILSCGPTGYQDYYPALYGGILALRPTFSGVSVEQIYSPEVARVLERRLLLIYSGETRLSGINNWEVYKGYFDKKSHVINGLHEIAQLANSAYQSLSNGNFDKFFDLLAQEGKLRESLFPGILTDGMRNLISKLLETQLIQGHKVCGAGGGGCFLLILKEEVGPKDVLALIGDKKFKHLPFSIKAPIS